MTSIPVARHDADMGKMSATEHHFRSPKNRDYTINVSGDEFNAPTFVPRLSYQGGGLQSVPMESLVDSIAQASDVAFFCDNSVFEDDAPSGLWEALFTEPGKLTITVEVMAELLPWLKVRPEHPVLKALRFKDSPIKIVSMQTLAEHDRIAGAYYTALLRARRRLIEMPSVVDEAARLSAESGASVTPYAVAQKAFGERAAKLSRKGVNDKLGTDEALVFQAARHSLETGQKAIILTKDSDIEEQFYKFFWLLDTHYRSMLIADLYSECFSRFPLHVMPDEFNEYPFQGDCNSLVRRPESLLHEVIPDSFRFVAVSCWRIGVKSSVLTFGAEREMYRVLHVKGKTGGLNTDRLGGRNFHAYLAPIPLPMGLRDCAAVAHDIRHPIPGSPASLAALDVRQALFPLERHGHYRRIPKPIEERVSLLLPASSRPTSRRGNKRWG
ncbi:hypothetical protein [Streptomyces hundungensis]|uniref:hypothetical protein n=1 Tax=Streptomyces hundungensis TaxID=1077946 RepID=UPI0031ED040D